jgi:hypothetical protein
MTATRPLISWWLRGSRPEGEKTRMGAVAHSFCDKWYESMPRWWWSGFAFSGVLRECRLEEQVALPFDLFKTEACPCCPAKTPTELCFAWDTLCFLIYRPVYPNLLYVLFHLCVVGMAMGRVRGG